MIIDFHNHYYPPGALDAVKTGSARVRLTTTPTATLVYYPGDYNILVPGHRDLDPRENVLREHGIDKQLITFTTPGVLFRTVFDCGDDQRTPSTTRRTRRFAAAATSRPWPHCHQRSAASVRELERAMKEHGLPGAMVFSNVNGAALAAPEFEPLWKWPTT